MAGKKEEAGGRDAAARQIRRIYESENLSEEDKDRMIAELLPRPDPGSRGLDPGKVAMAYLVSFLLPLSGLVLAIHYLFHYQEEGRKVAIICVILTVIGLVILVVLFNALTAALRATPF